MRTTTASASTREPHQQHQRKSNRRDAYGGSAHHHHHRPQLPGAPVGARGSRRRLQFLPRPLDARDLRLDPRPPRLPRLDLGRRRPPAVVAGPVGDRQRRDRQVDPVVLRHQPHRRAGAAVSLLLPALRVAGEARHRPAAAVPGLPAGPFPSRVRRPAAAPAGGGGGRPEDDGLQAAVAVVVPAGSVSAAGRRVRAGRRPPPLLGRRRPRRGGPARLDRQALLGAASIRRAHPRPGGGPTHPRADRGLPAAGEAGPHGHGARRGAPRRHPVLRRLRDGPRRRG
ncbi:hypothetical protein VTK73DRAFT_6157 [Phialemonium thermophilum]|uniref:Uncharacterized protein n=1 Tax=Phialemonium thermophilum TaxID=223376 RepID=A0ABR3UZX4_9PEZI